MAKAPDYFTKPPAEKIWKDAKKAAEVIAKKEGAAAPYAAHLKMFKDDLNPLVEKFISAWPDLTKITALHGKATTVARQYTKVTKDSPLPPKVKSAMLGPLGELIETLDARLLMAESSLSKGPAEKPMTSWTLIDLPDLMPRIRAASKFKGALADHGKIPFKIIVTEKKILEKLAENGNDPLLLQKVKDAVDLDAAGKRIAAEFDSVFTSAKGDEKKLIAAEAKLGKVIEEELAAACARGVKSVKDLDGLDGKDTWFKVKLAADVVLKGLSLAGSLISAAFGAAITFGVSGLASVVGIISDIVGLIDAVGDFASKAEAILKDLEKDAKELKISYEKANKKGGTIDGTEIWRTLAPMVKSIKKLEDRHKLLESKLLAVELDAHKASKALGKILPVSDELEKLISAARTGAQTDLDRLPKSSAGVWAQLVDQAAAVRTSVAGGIDAVIKAQENFTALKGRTDEMKTALAALRTAHTSKNLAAAQAGLDAVMTTAGLYSAGAKSLSKWGTDEGTGAMMTLPAKVRDGQKQADTLLKEVKKVGVA